MLRNSLGPCPIYCIECNGEVAPERVPIDLLLAEDIASWLSVQDALYRLWLASGEYEEMAAKALLNPSGSVNQTGLGLATSITQRGLRTYLWWFIEGLYDAPLVCPSCAGEFTDWPTRHFQYCEPCRIIL
jgi:hypothetical protein